MRMRAVWVAVGLLGATALGLVAASRGEHVNAMWLLTAAVCVYVLAFRFYSQFIADRVLGLDPKRPTPAVACNDGLDFVPTNKYVLFGHHFAAIAGAGPLVGPILASQLGYLPGVLWIVIGAVAAGAVQDFIILALSMRRGGRSLGEMVREEMGLVPGLIAQVGTFVIMIIILAVLALIVVKALAHSPWGASTVAATIPIALLMGFYMRFVRPGRIAEVSIAGFVLLILAVLSGRYISTDPYLASLFTLTELQLCWVLIAYGAVASILPVWLLLAPRDYLSTFMKIGAIVLLALGVFIVQPELRMPAFTQFIHGGGPVWSGSVFPFLFITIACGAVSGFHALISSGTTPKLIGNEADTRFVGYGAMLMESFVALMAILAASILDPAIYFAMNSPSAVVGADAQSAAAAITAMGFAVTPDVLTRTAQEIGEVTIISRAGGAPTLAVGMAHIFSQFLGGRAMMSFWYHFAILFEALFILTAIDAGTRAGRFMLQDLIGVFVPAFRKTSALVPNLVATGLCVSAWGFFLYQGATDPLGGVNTLWPLFALSNQMLACIALTFATVVLFKGKRHRYAWVTAGPAAWLFVCTLTAAFLKLFSSDPAVGFLQHASRISQGLNEGRVIAPAKSLFDMQKIVMNDRIDAALCAFFIVVTLAMTAYGVRACLLALRAAGPTARETSIQLAHAPA
ncbi:carbon starvation CstA family protein [Novosphingobium sp. Gsoil 351]|uniref:carbon starvation CstA family protein n=1 Tax=Novosphingobium sp. Gsoil 351 TaxID=2675225 RepID=UPI00272EDC29|nr:carbon starvation CstA family protein [Novosphingobium sp. Gsoil 351]